MGAIVSVACCVLHCRSDRSGLPPTHTRCVARVATWALEVSQALFDCQMHKPLFFSRSIRPAAARHLCTCSSAMHGSGQRVRVTRAASLESLHPAPSPLGHVGERVGEPPRRVSVGVAKEQGEGRVVRTQARTGRDVAINISARSGIEPCLREGERSEP